MQSQNTASIISRNNLTPDPYLKTADLESGPHSMYQNVTQPKIPSGVILTSVGVSPGQRENPTHCAREALNKSDPTMTNYQTEQPIFKGEHGKRTSIFSDYMSNYYLEKGAETTEASDRKKGTFSQAKDAISSSLNTFKGKIGFPGGKTLAKNSKWQSSSSNCTHPEMSNVDGSQKSIEEDLRQDDITPLGRIVQGGPKIGKDEKKVGKDGKISGGSGNFIAKNNQNRRNTMLPSVNFC
jgi:hypothetical protein